MQVAASTLFAPDASECLFTAKTETPHSLLWLAAIQIVEPIKNLPGLAPKDSFIATEAVERIVGQIAEPQETTCEFNIRSNLALGQSQSCSWARLDCIRDTVRRDLPIRGCIEKRINDLTRDRGDLVRLSKVTDQTTVDCLTTSKCKTKPILF